jgi:Tannase and feruloyl esterase
MRMRLMLAFVLASVGFVSSAWGASTPCEKLAQLALPETKITSAEVVAAGAFTVPKMATPWLVGDPAFYKQLPAFCRVMADAKPTADSDIKIEVWMPVSGWNGRFRGQGNGGFAGEIDYRSLGVAILHGYASAGTDTGHAGSGIDATWALGHPEKIVDFAYRGIHAMTQVGKASVAAFYGEVPKHSYFANCSNGGRQALMEAQKFPEDYDGILAGAPANYWTHLVSSSLWDMQATTLDQASYIPSSKMPAIASAVLAACDGQEGVKDGLLNDPRKCEFHPETMLCKGPESDACLTQPQIVALKKLYQGAHDARGNAIFPGFVTGGEAGEGGWPLWITGPAPGKALLFAFDYGFFADMVYSDPAFDYRKANLDQAVAEADKKFATVLNATEIDMKAFAARGGKLIVYHGWSDGGISPLNSVHYYESVVQRMGKPEADAFLRLFMVPGMQHCGGGPGTDVFGDNGIATSNDPQHDIYLTLQDWVEKGTPPATVIAAKLDGMGPGAKVTMTRPLCAYPLVAKYKGSGDPNDAANFACVKEK